MMESFPLVPPSASSFAPEIDLHFVFLVGVTAFFSALIFALVIVFAVRFRRRSAADRPAEIHGDLRLEAAWTAVPLVIVLVTFAWSARIYLRMASPPDGALEIVGVGRQWMWKFQHPDGRREVNELHLPAGRPVKILLTSEDVIHSLYIPAFRVKKDAVPGRYTALWFTPTRPGSYHLFCAEYCGTEHAGMGGWAIVMAPEEYARWLSGGSAGEAPAAAGARLFVARGCASCHRTDGTGTGPSLAGVFGSRVTIRDGSTVVADEGYIRESILRPAAKVTHGYDPVMPTYEGLLSEEDLFALVQHVKSMKEERP